MSELENLIKQATSLNEGSKTFMDDYAKSIAGDVDNKIQSDEVKTVFNIDKFLHEFKNNSIWRKVQTRPQFQETINRLSEDSALTPTEIEDKLIMNIKGMVDEKVSSGLTDFKTGMFNAMSYFSKGVTDNVQLRDTIRETYKFHPLRIF